MATDTPQCKLIFKKLKSKEKFTQIKLRFALGIALGQFGHPNSPSNPTQLIRGAINFFVSGSLEFWLNNFCKHLLALEAHGQIFALLINILWRAKRVSKCLQKLFLNKIGQNSINWNEFAENTELGTNYQ